MVHTYVSRTVDNSSLELHLFHVLRRNMLPIHVHVDSNIGLSNKETICCHNNRMWNPCPFNSSTSFDTVTFNRTCKDKAGSTGVESNLWYFGCLHSAWLECTLLDLLAHKSNNVLCSLRFTMLNAFRFALLCY